MFATASKADRDLSQYIPGGPINGPVYGGGLIVPYSGSFKQTRPQVLPGRSRFRREAVQNHHIHKETRPYTRPHYHDQHEPQILPPAYPQGSQILHARVTRDINHQIETRPAVYPQTRPQITPGGPVNPSQILLGVHNRPQFYPFRNTRSVPKQTRPFERSKGVENARINQSRPQSVPGGPVHQINQPQILPPVRPEGIQTLPAKRPLPDHLKPNPPFNQPKPQSVPGGPIQQPNEPQILPAVVNPVRPEGIQTLPAKRPLPDHLRPNSSFNQQKPQILPPAHQQRPQILPPANPHQPQILPPVFPSA